ncbi:MAG: dienelactone hydrolase family protein [Anaerolineaceae bacterium]|nr:dienelactone hydrolase family protein [Anaerolineaceae bacterium]
MTQHGKGTEVITIQAGDVMLEGNLSVPDGAQGIVVFVHGSGSSRFSPRNQFVADQLHRGGLATVLFDLLTAEEDAIDRRTRELRFDIDLLADRVVGATDWLLQQPFAAERSIGYFGSSTGAAAALIASTRRPKVAEAIVSRGGRPDLAGPALPEVQAPTLLIVGGHDEPVIQMNRQAMQQIPSEASLEIVPGASHLFEEPGTLEKAAHLARDWFRQYLN